MRVKGPLVRETKIISGLLLTCSRTWVVGNVVWFYDGCTTDVYTWAWILVTTNDLGGGGFIVICLVMINYGPYSRAMSWWHEILVARKIQGNQQEEKVQPEGLQTIPRRDGFIPKLFGMTDSYGYKASTGIRCLDPGGSLLPLWKIWESLEVIVNHKLSK